MAYQSVSISGVYQTKHEGSKPSENMADIIFEAAKGALDDAGLTRQDVDTVVLADHDLIEGRAIVSMLSAPPAGAHQKDEIRVAEDGIFGPALAYLRLLSGEYGTALVVTHSKTSEGPLDITSNLNFDPFFHREFALNWITTKALQAMKYVYTRRVGPEAAAQVVVKNRGNAVKNDKAHLRERVTVQQVLKSKPVATPLRKLDLPPTSDGAAAIVMATGERAKKTKSICVRVRGAYWSNDTYYLGDKELGELGSLAVAAKKAYKMAGITDPVKELDVAEISDVSSYHELMTYEALGLCPKGKGASLIEKGITSMRGALPVNPSGGCLSTNPYTAVGMIRLIEAVLQLRGKAGEHQVPDARVALAHGTSGMASQSNCVFILER